MTETESRTSRFWEAVEAYRHVIRLLFFLTLTLLTVTVFVLIFGDLPTDAHIISVVNLVLQLLVLGPLAYVLWRTAK